MRIMAGAAWKKMARTLAVGMTCCAALSASGTEGVVATNETSDAVLDTIAQINHINWVVNVIKSYNNPVVLEEEYEKISYGNLNLNRIPDEETLGRITRTLDTLYGLRKSEREMKFWRAKFIDSRMRKTRDYNLDTFKRVREKITSTAGNFLANLATLNVAGLVAETAYDISTTAIRLHYDYDNFVHEFDQQMRERRFSFDTEKMDKLHAQNKEMLEDQWRLISRYRLDDGLRVSDRDIKTLVGVLKEGDQFRLYTRLAPMRSRFKLFPEYWYYLSSAALATGHYEDGLVACDTFFKVNRGIFRDDPMEGIVALNKAFMLPNTEENKPEIRRCLETVWKNNQTKDEWAQDYLAASLYEGALGDHANAAMLLEHAIASLESSMHDRKQHGKSIAEQVRLLGEYRKLLLQAQGGTPSGCEMPIGEFVSPVDRLRYIAKDKRADAWNVISNDLSEIGLTRDGDLIHVAIPSQWVLPGNFDVKLVARQGEAAIAEASGNTSARKVDKGNAFRLSFALPRKALDKVDSLQLVLAHGECPIEMTYASNSLFVKGGAAYTMSYRPVANEAWLSSLCDDLRLCEFSFNGDVYRKVHGAGKFSKDVARRQASDSLKSCHALVPLDGNEFPYASGRGVLDGAIELLTVTTSDEVALKYRNKSDRSMRPDVSILFINEFGSVVAAVSDDYFEKRTETKREEWGIVFDKYYTDFKYVNSLAPGAVREFHAQRPKYAVWLAVIGSARYNMTESRLDRKSIF